MFFKNKGRFEAVDRRKRKKQIEKNVSIGIFVFFALLFLAYWIKDENAEQSAENFIIENRITELIKIEQYDRANFLLDSGINASSDFVFTEILERKKLEVKELSKKKMPTPSYRPFMNKIDRLIDSLYLEKASEEIATALNNKKFSKREIIELGNMQKKLDEDRYKIDNGDSKHISREYRVKPNEDAQSIAKRYKMTTEELLQLNNLEEEKIREGKQILVLHPITFVEHTVKSGESLTSISTKYKVPIEKLKRLNRLSSDVLQPNKVIKISYGFLK
ncbi:MAG: LysM peptidoglycan-binding domain-containing protein [Bacteroidetes bacterium]|nr:MAG: LysM peptidoglycan-binding domain-containing protein [Bacteroidota bacterium]